MLTLMLKSLILVIFISVLCFFTALDSDGQGSTFLHEMSHLFAKTTDAVPSSPPAPSDAQSAYWIQQAVPNTRSFLKLYVDAFATLFK